MNALGAVVRALITRYARTHVLRSVVTLFAVALGVASAFAIDLANATAIQSFADSVNVIANRVNVQVVGTGEGFDERTLLRVERVPGVIVASPVVTGEILVGSSNPGMDGELVHVLGIDITRASVPPGVRGAQQAAAFDLATFFDRDGILISRRIANAYHCSVGCTLRAYVGTRAVRLPVLGVIPPGTIGVDSSVAFVDIATAQTLFDEVGKLDRIDVEADPQRREATQRAIEAILPHGARVLTPANRLSEIARMLASFTLNLSALADVALLVGMYLIYNAVAISVVQRASEIGTLRALGTSRVAIFLAFVIEGGAYGIVGSLFGLLFGFLLARVSLSAVQATVSALYVGSHSDAVVVAWWPILKAGALGTLLAMLAAIVPAWRAASMPPSRTMRNTGAAESGSTRSLARVAIVGAALLVAAVAVARLPALGDGIPVWGYAAGIFAIAGSSLLSPWVLVRAAAVLRVDGKSALTIARAFVRASPRRLAVALASLMVAVAMMVAIAVLVGSFRSTIVAWTRDTLAADVYITTPGTVDASYRGDFSPATLQRIARVPGVASVDGIRRVDVPFEGRYAQLGAVDVPTLLARKTLRFLGHIDSEHLGRALVGRNAVVVSVPFATHFNVNQGDTIVLDTPAGNVALRVVALYNDYSTGGGTFFMDRTTFVRLYHDVSYDSLAAYLQTGADVAHVRTAIERAVAPQRVDIATNGELRAYALTVFDQTFAITRALYVVSIVIAILGVVSTLFALVLERRLDIALLRYIGMSRAGVARVIYVQAAFLGALAGLLGIALGIALAADLIYVINRQSFGWLIEWHSPGWFYVEAFFMVVGAAVLSAIYPARIAGAIATSEILRVE